METQVIPSRLDNSIHVAWEWSSPCRTTESRPELRILKVSLSRAEVSATQSLIALITMVCASQIDSWSSFPAWSENWPWFFKLWHMVHSRLREYASRSRMTSSFSEVSGRDIVTVQVRKTVHSHITNCKILNFCNNVTVRYCIQKLPAKHSEQKGY